MTDDAHSRLDVPVRPRPSWVTVVWAISPAVLFIGFVEVFGKTWPYLAWVAFFAGLINMYVFSAVHLYDRKVESWEMKAVGLTLGMLVLNAGLVLGWDLIR